MARASSRKYYAYTMYVCAGKNIISNTIKKNIQFSLNISLRKYVKQIQIYKKYKIFICINNNTFLIVYSPEQKLVNTCEAQEAKPLKVSQFCYFVYRIHINTISYFLRNPIQCKYLKVEFISTRCVSEMEMGMEWELKMENGNLTLEWLRKHLSSCGISLELFSISLGCTGVRCPRFIAPGVDLRETRTLEPRL